MEVWKEIDGYAGVYFVSNYGNVKSIDHFLEGRLGSGKQNGRILKQQICVKGYSRVSLSNNSKKFTTGAHRLVALSFIPNPENKPQVNHINGIKTDNRVENLEWCTNSENQLHAVKNKLTNPPTGEKHHLSKLRNEDVIKARACFEIGFSNKELAKDYGVSQTAMSKILRRITYINI
jgi:transcriptional regulator of met regulon